MSALRVASPFDALKVVDETGTERWAARDLLTPLGYVEWRNFQVPIDRARAAMKNTGEDYEHHFVEGHRMVPIGSGTERSIRDILLTREAAYLVAMNSDPHKEEVAAAQRYFAQQTRRQELAQEQAAALAMHPSSIGGALAALNLAVQVLNEHEGRIGAVESRLAALETRPVGELPGGTGFVSVRGWCRTHRITATTAQISAWSRRCGRLSHELALPVGEVPDERWGVVRTYRTEVLAEIVGVAS